MAGTPEQGRACPGMTLLAWIKASRRLPSCVHQRARILQVLGGDRVGGPIGQRPDRPGRIVAVLLREHGSALEEQIVRAPRVHISVPEARWRIGADLGPPVLWVDW